MIKLYKEWVMIQFMEVFYNYKNIKGPGNDFIIFEDHSSFIANIWIPTATDLYTYVSFSDTELD